jgi:hypothetical protein
VARRPARGLAFWAAVGGTSVLSLIVLNVAADRLPVAGLSQLRDYAVRRNG